MGSFGDGSRLGSSVVSVPPICPCPVLSIGFNVESVGLLYKFCGLGFTSSRIKLSAFGKLSVVLSLESSVVPSGLGSVLLNIASSLVKAFGRVIEEAATYTAKDNNPMITAMYGLSSFRPVENCICLPKHYMILR